MKSNFKLRLLKLTQREIKKIKDRSPTKRNINYPEFIKDNILELLNDGFRTVDLLSEDLGVSKTFIYSVRKRGGLKKEKISDKKTAKNYKNDGKNNIIKNNDNIFDFLDITSSLKSDHSQKTSTLKIPKNVTGGNVIFQENQSKNIEKIHHKSEDQATDDKIKPFMKVSSPSGYTIEIWG